MTRYVELQVATNFSFLRGASQPEELATQAAELGYTAIGITDRNSLAGVVRTHSAIKFLHGKAKEAGVDLKLRLVVGVRLDLEDGPSFLCYPIDRAAYGRLAQLLTLGKRRTEKGACTLRLADILDGEVLRGATGQVLAVVPPDTLDEAFVKTLANVRSKIRNNLYLVVNFLYFGDDRRRIAALAELAARHGIPLLATNDVHAHAPERRPLQDVLTCIREGCTIHNAGFRLFGNAERHFKHPDEMARLFAAYPEAIANAARIAETCTFSLDEFRYEYLVDPIPDGRTPQQELERLARDGAQERYPHGVPDKVTQQIARELTLIGELKYAPYFLTIFNIMEFARSRGILCQGRGSAANSTVCYVLKITEVDPVETDLVFDRFISTAREEPPDIDVDFEHERREEVIQHIYEKYGRDHAGLTATVITYRTKSAFRDVGKALGLSEDSIQALQGSAWGHYWNDDPNFKEGMRLREAGLDPNDATIRQVLELVRQIRRFPRHLSQHTGGFVVTKMPLDTVVPIENAAMANRTVIEWDKDDLDAVGIFKIDILALGMLTCIRKTFELIERHFGGPRLTLDSVPKEDPETYDMLCEADSIGVFQVESRAQMNMLPRLRPRKFYDLVIEVAIVRPGPIQGGMVHPYLRRRLQKEPVVFPKPELEAVLGKTLGVPLFQEQAMQIAMVAAGFTAAEADRLRRSMASFRRNGEIDKFRDKLIDGMEKNGYERDFAERCFSQIEGFGDYGFPQSHAASFAKLVYVSAWLKCHYPAAFAAALLNSQPMGFYAPAQIVRDARQHGVEVRPIDVNHSDWDCTLEPTGPADPALPPSDLPAMGNPAWRAPEDRKMALRLGFREIKGMSQKDADMIVARRELGYRSVAEIKARVQPKAKVLEILSRADAFSSLGLARRAALWAAKGLKDAAPLPLFEAVSDDRLRPEPGVELPDMSLGEQVADDYRMLKMSLKAHPMKLLRGSFEAERTLSCGALTTSPDGTWVRVAGLVLIRQRPGEGNAIFITLEDETGIANVIVWPHQMERYRRAVIGASLMCVEGKLQREGIVTHIISNRIHDMTYRLGYLVRGARADRLDFDGGDPRDRKKPVPLPASRDFH
jgi:error-prone DNA polymerase